jgi:regulator of protease activity HflC (stomatin/prohibitin superfamily)
MNRTTVILSSAGIAAALAFALWGLPRLGVYNRTLSGRAALMEAESTRQVRVLEAKAKRESATLEAEAEIERAKGVAEANKIIGKSLENNPRYLQFMYIRALEEGAEKGNKTVYVPTEGGMPVPVLEIEK